MEETNDVLHWIWSWRLQVRRLRESFEREWSSVTGLERRQMSSQFSFDEHMLAVTGWNLLRAIRRAEPYLPEIEVSEDQIEGLRLLRNLYEHWDEQRRAFESPEVPKERSAADFVQRFPEGRPWTMVFAADDWILGGVVGINELGRELEMLEGALLEAEAKTRSAE